VTRISIAVSLVAAAALCGCATSVPDERLHSTLWVQTSAEYWAVTTQIFAAAAVGLEAARDDPDWSASIDGRSDRPLPPAIIIDVDETVLDNSGHTARSIRARRGFNSDSWREWVREASAPALPGALSYLQHAADLGIAIIYVTNRHLEKEAATRINLAAVGAPLRDDIDDILTRDEQPDWGRDKVTRRQWVSERYRVLQIVGDDLQDFVSLPAGITAGERIEIAQQHRERWGRGWFLIPNPIYGSWEQALMHDGATVSGAPAERKVEYLDPAHP
jgi:acid phosphatase